MTINRIRPLRALLFGVLFLPAGLSTPLGAAPLRPPSVPLVANDPYFSIWSPADRLTDTNTVHWTGKPHRLNSFIRIDDRMFRLIGEEPADIEALPQTSVEVLPTRTVCRFSGQGLSLTLTFTTPALPSDLDLLARPVTYLTYTLAATDGTAHDVRLMFGASSELAVNTPDQEVKAFGESVGPLARIRMGTVAQPVLAKKGDDLRIDWGYLHVAAPRESVAAYGPVRRAEWLEAMKRGQPIGRVTRDDVTEAAGDALVAALTMDVGQVEETPVSRWLILAYDDEYSIAYMRRKLRPYWRRDGWDADDLLRASAREYASLQERCASFDRELMGDLEDAGGPRYAQLAALAYRQCFAAGKFVADANGQPLQFSKENHSNGCIGTSDVFYPMSPQFLLFGPTLAKTFVVPFMEYAAGERWTFPFAPHDLGTYPHANGQVYGGGEHNEENQMPVEESGNLLILFAAIAHMEGHAGFADRYWPQLQQWANYLRDKGFDPENQLCTDDFAGHLAHNVNLSAKAICGLASFATLCRMSGDTDQADTYQALAKSFTRRWLEEADDGDFFRLAFDRPGSWSQKYNIVWDRILGFDLWPDEAVRKEMAHYRAIQNPYGLPLDLRRAYTKLDWVLWTATLTGERGDFEALVDPVYRFLQETPDRVPMTDWYQTRDARRVGFTARPVVGGVFLRLLYDQTVWAKWAGRDTTRASNWAPMPKPPIIRTVVPAADVRPGLWRLTTQDPGPGWHRPDFDDSAWTEARAGFGTRGTPSARVGTEWSTNKIWIRRRFDLPEGNHDSLQLWLHHDEDADLFINGVPALQTRGWTTSYDAFPIHDQARATLRPGPNLLAIHCRQTDGGQYIDCGLSEVQWPE